MISIAKSKICYDKDMYSGGYDNDKKKSGSSWFRSFQNSITIFAGLKDKRYNFQMYTLFILM
jgi:hypothetical protein